jgi:squalene-associated FAD-dependent desaturase
MKVIVVGAGFAGLAAAIRLQERRHEVVLLERRGVLGGRATSARDAVTGDAVDNGTHLMIGGYASTLALLRQAGATDLVDVQESLRLDYVDERGPSALVCPPVLAPLHLGLGLLTQRLPWRVRWDALRFGLSVRFGRRPEGLTLAELFVRTSQSAETRRLLWDPLATAILNETPARADAGVFVTSFRTAFLQRARDSALVFARVGLGEIAGRLGEYFVARGGGIRRGTRVGEVEVESGRVRGVAVAVRPKTRAELEAGVRSYHERLEADAVVLAVPWNAVEELVPEPWRSGAPFAGLADLGASPIASVDLWLDRPVLERPMIGLRDEEMEWVFDKGRLLGREGAPQYLSFVASAARRAQPRTNAELVASALGALRRYFPAAREASVVRSLVRREPEATFVCSPGHERLRPGAATPIEGLYLAGDWTKTGLPATIEGAVRSGVDAASAVERAAGKGQQHG